MKANWGLYLFYLVASCLVMESCSSSRQGLFTRKTPHEKYQSALKEAELSGTVLYDAWISAAESGLRTPVSIVVPYKENGFFAAEVPRSGGYAFNARKGEKIIFSVEKQPAEGRIFSELWKMEDTARKLLYAADSLEHRWEFEIEDDGKYLVRLQPELLHASSYTLTISAGPSLAFPVKITAKPKTSSFWGDSRDAGTRRHEGIDIFAPKRTPAVAAAAGLITRVGTNNLGGNVVFMRPDGRNIRLYYAHLDTQMVRDGQRVSAGDIIGLIGNTGNARTTPPHLHFGIYGNSGAVDPFPFVNADRPAPPIVDADTAQLNKLLRTNGKAQFLSSLLPSAPAVTLEQGTITKPIAATGKWFKIELPDGSCGFIKSNQLTDRPLPLKLKTSSDSVLYQPFAGSPVRGIISSPATVTVYGTWKEYAYVKTEGVVGWMERTLVE